MKTKGVKVEVGKAPAFNINVPARMPNPIWDVWDKRISPSQIGMFMRCSLQWYFRYKCGLKKPPNGKLANGRSIHASLEKGYMAVHKTGNMLSASDLCDIYRDDLRQERSGARVEHEVDIPILESKEGKWSDIEKKGISAVKVYRKELMPKIRPGVLKIGKVKQPGIEFKFDKVSLAFTKDKELSEITVTCILDLYDSEGIIIDHKTTGRRWTEGVFRNRDKIIQLIMYDMLMRGLKISKPAGVRFDIMVMGAKGAKIQQVPNDDSTPLKIPKVLYQQALEIIRMMKRSVEQELFAPCYGMHCSWCGFQGECYAWTGRK